MLALIVPVIDNFIERVAATLRLSSKNSVSIDLYLATVSWNQFIIRINNIQGFFENVVNDAIRWRFREITIRIEYLFDIILIDAIDNSNIFSSCFLLLCKEIFV